MVMSFRKRTTEMPVQHQNIGKAMFIAASGNTWIILYEYL